MSSYGLESLAIHGRHGDTLIGHLSTGEMVLPRPIANDPILKRELFNAFERHDLNPNQYSVGHYENSLNPITGVPEFGFKLKKITKSLKKAAGTIGTVVGFAVGGPMGATIGGGIGGGVQTGSLDGALKGAATGMVLANVAVGMGIQPNQGLSSLNPFGTEALVPGTGGSVGLQKSTFFLNPANIGPAAAGAGGISGFFQDVGAGMRGVPGISDSFKTLNTLEKAAAIGLPLYASGVLEAQPEEPAEMPGPSGALSGYLQNPLGEAVVPSVPGDGMITGSSGGTSGPYTGFSGQGSTNNTSTGLDPATDAYIRNALGDEDYIKLMFPEFARANLNSGGEALDLRNTGGDIEDPEGSGDKDTVNAILADGEFVVTKQAVKGIGDGDHDKGIETLYAMMDKNENKAKNMGIGRA